MIYMGDAAWWNKRFGDRSPELLKYDAKLFEDIDYFPRDGKVLDVACGDGRNAIFLSSRGYALDAIDFSEVAINRLQSFAEKEQQHISTTQVDLSGKGLKCNVFYKLQFKMECFGDYPS